MCVIALQHPPELLSWPVDLLFVIVRRLRGGLGDAVMGSFRGHASPVQLARANIALAANAVRATRRHPG